MWKKGKKATFAKSKYQTITIVLTSLKNRRKLEHQK